MSVNTAGAPNNVVQDDGTCRATTQFKLCIHVSLVSRILILIVICCSYTTRLPNCSDILHKLNLDPGHLYKRVRLILIHVVQP